MEFDDVRAFVAVADAGSVSCAARNLHLTQPAVTRRLQRLESALGCPLLDRRTRPVRLTPAGRSALDRCRRLLNDIREVRAAAVSGALAEEIGIGVAHALTEVTLTHPVEALRLKFPKIALRLSTGWSRDLLDRVRSQALDAAVILLPRGERLPPEVVGRAVGKDRLVVVASRRGRLAPVRRIQDLAGAQWILNPGGCAARAALRLALLAAKIDMAVAVESYQYELQLALVARDRGLSLVPERILARSRLRSRLRVLRVPGLHFPLTIWTVHRQRSSGLDSVIAELSRLLGERL